MRKSGPKINDKITAPKLRVIDTDGSQVGIVSKAEAIDMAQNRGLDLVEVSPDADPPVCKILDYGKYKYKQSKKEKVTKKKQHTIQTKEIRLRPKIEAHDLNFKINHARKFLEKGFKVKAYVMFRGREMAHKEFAQDLLDRIAAELEDVAVVEKKPEMEGRFMIMYLTKK